ncbi:uncharacterized protein LOC134256334 [Saccostrea cucullata]|uniref:uncharacterized protein LOC134256334 n=1 Tax=Saccostrea cuccullata TaxID=36930 RepID=UPI002ED347DF
MTPRNSAKDVMQICDLCETNVVQMHCDTCLVNLCKVCVEKHMNSDGTKTHKLSERVSVVNKVPEAKLTLDPQTSAQDVLRCDNCETDEIELQCKTCIVYLCTTHVGEHIISDRAKDHNIVLRQSRKFNPFIKQGMDFPIKLTFEPKEVADVVAVLRRIEDIYPEESDVSLTHQLLQSLHLEEFRSRLKSLKSRVILVDPSNLCEDSHAGDGRVCIYKVEVKPSYGQLTVYEPTVSLDQFTNIHHLPKSFLVTSNFEPVIDTKFAVDEKYHYMLEENKVRIFHESDPDKKLLLLCTKYTIDSFKDRVEKLINSIPMYELHQIVNRAAGIAFSEKEIQKGIQDIYIVHEGHYIGSVYSGNYFCRLPFKIGRIREELITETLNHVGKQFTDMLLIGILKNIQNTLEAEFSHMVCTINIRDNSLMNPQGILIFAGLVSFVARVLNPVLGIIVSVFTILPAVLTFFQPVNVNSVEWRNKVANEIYMNISAKKSEIMTDVFRKLESICDQTKKELREIGVKLAKASRRISLVD